MQITIKNLTNGNISLPGPLPLLEKNVQITQDISPEDYNHFSDNMRKQVSEWMKENFK